MMNGVGGSSIHYGMEQWRYLPQFQGAFGDDQALRRERDPAGSTVADWPISYSDLEPYYDKVEYDMGVSGEAGNINGKKIPGGNPFEAPRKRPTPCRRCGAVAGPTT